MPVVTDYVPVVTPYAHATMGAGSRPHLAKAIMSKGWPLAGVAGAMAANAWLPAQNPSIGFVVLGAEILLGAFAAIRLLSLARN